MSEKEMRKKIRELESLLIQKESLISKYKELLTGLGYDIEVSLRKQIDMTKEFDVVVERFTPREFQIMYPYQAEQILHKIDKMLGIKEGI